MPNLTGQIRIPAGNAGQERPEAPNAPGDLLGRIADSRIVAQGLDHVLEWEVMAIASKASRKRDRGLVRTAGICHQHPARTVIGSRSIEPGEFVETYSFPIARCSASTTRFITRPMGPTGQLHRGLLAPSLSKALVVRVTSGIWEGRFQGVVVRDGIFHVWIERDEPADLEDDSHFLHHSFGENKMWMRLLGTDGVV
ncbi:hypothetical protein NKH47_25850 [Mesorhizobium sp. M1060]|uniref:hypothetical protein n=1 Tax=Mesorhizobium sp. M1060 TaxID=2957052 RepID=UPI003335B391